MGSVARTKGRTQDLTLFPPLQSGADISVVCFACALCLALWRSCAGLELNGGANLPSNSATVRPLDWSVANLSLVHVATAAFEAQSACIAATRSHAVTRLIHLKDVSEIWMAKASEWRRMLQPQQPPTTLKTVTADVHAAAHRYFSRVLNSSEPFNPFVHALLGIPFPSTDAASASWPLCKRRAI